LIPKRTAGESIFELETVPKRLLIVGGGPVGSELARKLATGRRPNVEGLGLEAAGVAFTSRGITVDDRCRTSARHIFACGDVTGRYQFTHMSEHMAKVAATNAILKWPARIDVRHVPWCTFTDPELAHVGSNEGELRKARIAFDVYRSPYGKVDRAITDGEAHGGEHDRGVRDAHREPGCDGEADLDDQATCSGLRRSPKRTRKSFPPSFAERGSAITVMAPASAHVGRSSSPGHGSTR